MRLIESAILLLAVGFVSHASGQFGGKDFADSIAEAANKLLLGEKSKPLSNSTDLLIVEPFALSRVDVKAAKRYNLVRARFIGGIDYHLTKNLLFWSEVSTGAIRSRALNAKGRDNYLRNLLVDRSPRSWRPKAIAVDYLADNLYVLDSKANKVHVFDLNGNFSTVIYDGPLEQPMDIAVDPSEGLIFIADGHRILRMNMDGSSAVAIVSYNRYNIKSVALDLVNKRVYWSEEAYHRIKSAAYDGTQLVIALKNERGKPYNMLGPANMAFRDDTLYFYDDIFRRINSLRVDPKTGVIVDSSFKLVYDGIGVRSMKVVDSHRHESEYELENPCREENGGCQQICLIAGRDADGRLARSCACEGTLADDLRSCLN